MKNWYKQIRVGEAFGVDPFGGSHLSDRVRSSPYGHMGGDERSGLLEPSSGKNHPNNYISEEKENFLTEKQLEEEKKQKNKKKKKVTIKRKKQIKLDDVSPKEILSYVDYLSGKLKKNGANGKAVELKHLVAFMPVINVSKKYDQEYEDSYSEFVDRMLVVIGDSVNFLSKNAQWGLKGPKIPTWGDSDWMLDTYKEIMGNDNQPQEVEMDDLLGATGTVNATAGQAQEIGSAFFVDSNLMLTCHHVVNPGGSPAQSVSVKFQEKDYEVSVIASDPVSDIALLSVNDPSFSFDAPLQIGSSGDIKQGEKILIIGTPLGFENVVGEGIVSSTSIDYTETGMNKKYILISTNINPGNSGGPVVKESDHTVIGIAAAVINTEQAGNSGLNAAIPIDDAKQMLGT